MFEYEYEQDDCGRYTFIRVIGDFIFHRFPILDAAIAMVVAVLAFFATGGVAQTIEVQADLVTGQDRPGFEIVGLTDADIERLNELESNGQLESVFQAFVAGQSIPMMARVILADDRLVLEPRFPLVVGARYEVRLGLDSLRGATPLTRAFTLPGAEVVTPEVAGVFPSSDCVPQNLLKMYLRFSAPMNRGEAYHSIRFLDKDGRRVEEAFLEIPQELWDASGCQFTILFDPGRIKRGLARHEQLDLPFQVGQTYTLVVDDRWRSAALKKLDKSERHSFTVVEPDRTQPDPDKWTIRAPTAGSHEPLFIDFGEPLDRAMLDHAIEVFQVDQRVPGETTVSRGETQWSFTPHRPWTADEFVIEIDSRLEDLAGNSIARPFEIESLVPEVDRSRFDVRPRRLLFTISSE